MAAVPSRSPLSPGQLTGMASAKVQATLGYGWHTACVVTGLGLAGLLKARATRA